MEFYVKLEDGTFRKATQDEVLGGKVDLYDAEGKQLGKRASSQKVDKDPVEELTQTVKDLALAVGTVADIKAKQEEIEAKMAAYSQVKTKGFPLPKGIDNNTSVSDADQIYAGYDLAMQGKRLTDSIAHPKTFISDERRMELAKYFTLFIKAGVMRDEKAQQVFRQKYVQKTGTTQIGDSGNTWVLPDIVESEILHFARERSVVLQHARLWPMISDKQSFPQESTGVAVAWGNTTAESDPTTAEFELDAYELSAFSAIRNETLADSRSDIVSWLTELMAEACGLELDNCAFNGDGTSTYAGCSGLLTAKCGYSVVMASGSTSFANMTFTHLSDMIGKLDGMKKEGAMFMMNGAVLHYIRTLKDDQSRPVFVDTIGGPMSGTIFGYPYKEVIRMPSTNAANTAFMNFGNLKYFAIGRRLDSAALQLDPYGLWTTNRTRFKIYQRWGLGIALPNGFVRLLTAAQ